MPSAQFFHMLRSASILTELNLSALVFHWSHLRSWNKMFLWPCPWRAWSALPEAPSPYWTLQNHSSHNCFHFHSPNKNMKVWADEKYRVYGKNRNVDGDCGDKRRSPEGGESWTVDYIPILYWTMAKNAKIVQGTRLLPRQLSLKWVLSLLSTMLMLSVAFFWPHSLISNSTVTTGEMEKVLS